MMLQILNTQQKSMNAYVNTYNILKINNTSFPK